MLPVVYIHGRRKTDRLQTSMTEHPDLAALATALTAGDHTVRADAAETLCHLGEAAAPAAVPLVRACGDDDDRVREWAGAALEGLGSPPAHTTSDLAGLAAAEDPLAAYWAVTLLGRLGEGASAAVPVLIGRLGEDVDPAVAQRAAWALGKIGPSAAAAVEPLRHAATSDDPRLARLAGEAITAITAISG